MEIQTKNDLCCHTPFILMLVKIQILVKNPNFAKKNPNFGQNTNFGQNQNSGQNPNFR